MAQVKDFPKLEVKRFAIALCSRGVWGVITSESPKEIEFKDGSKSLCHTGFACRGTVIAGWGVNEGKTIIKRQGDSWASRAPHVIGYLEGINPNQPIEEILEYARRKLTAVNL